MCGCSHSFCLVHIKSAGVIKAHALQLNQRTQQPVLALQVA